MGQNHDELGSENFPSRKKESIDLLVGQEMFCGGKVRLVDVAVVWHSMSRLSNRDT